MEIKYPDKSDSDLAIELLFGAFGYTSEKQKEMLGGRYTGAKQEIIRLMDNNAVLLTSVQMYLKKFGCDRLT